MVKDSKAKSIMSHCILFAYSSTEQTGKITEREKLRV